MESNFLLDVLEKNPYFANAKGDARKLKNNLQALAMGQPYNPVSAVSLAFFGASTVMSGIFGYMNRKRTRDQMRANQDFQKEMLRKKLQFQRATVLEERKHRNAQQLKQFEFQKKQQDISFKEAKREGKINRKEQERLSTLRIMEQRRLRVEDIKRSDRLRKENQITQDELKHQVQANQRISQIDQLDQSFKLKGRELKKFVSSSIQAGIQSLLAGRTEQTALQFSGHSSTVQNKTLAIANKLQEKIAKSTAGSMSSRAGEKIELVGEAREALSGWKQDIKEKGHSASVEGSRGHNAITNVLRRLDEDD